MDDFKYRTIFAAKVKALEKPDEEIELEAKASLKEATASLQNLRVLAADIKPEDDPDLLYIVANLAVAGKVNLNDDAVTTEDALSFYKRFEKKFVDIEHNRSHCVGFIVKAGLSEFGTDRILTEDEARKLPFFNITTVSALWKSVNRPLCNMIVDASNPSSPYYRDVSLSFEVGFSGYDIGVGPTDDRDLSKAKKLVAGGEEFTTLTKRLRANDGNGLTEDGKDTVYRVLKGSIRPLGQGIVTTPAAQVKGIEVIDEDKELSDEEVESALQKVNSAFKVNGKTLQEALALADAAMVLSTSRLADAVALSTEAGKSTIAILNDLSAAVQEKSIKSPILSVSTVNANKTMKYNTLEEIEKNWADIVKADVASDISFANVRDFFAATVLAESKRMGDEAKAAKDAAEKVKKDMESVAAAREAAEKLLGEVKAELDGIKAKQAELEAQTKFDERMAAIAEKFDFTDEERALVVAKIRNLNDADYKTWTTEADILYKEKTKAYKATKATELKDAIKAGLEKAGVKGTVSDKDINFAEIFASVKVTDTPIVNQVDLAPNTAKDMMAKAFGGVSFGPAKKK